MRSSKDWSTYVMRVRFRRSESNCAKSDSGVSVGSSMKSSVRNVLTRLKEQREIEQRKNLLSSSSLNGSAFGGVGNDGVAKRRTSFERT